MPVAAKGLRFEPEDLHRRRGFEGASRTDTEGAGFTGIVICPLVMRERPVSWLPTYHGPLTSLGPDRWAQNELEDWRAGLHRGLLGIQNRANKGCKGRRRVNGCRGGGAR